MLAWLVLACGTSPAPIGRFPKALCLGQRVFVGRVTRTDARFTPEQRIPVNTDVVFDVERNLRGEGERFEWTLPGGLVHDVELNGRHEPFVEVDVLHIGRVEVGERWMIGLVPNGGGEWRFAGAVRLPVTTELLPEPEMKRVFEAQCAG